MEQKNNYTKFKYLFLISTFAGVAGIYISYKYQTPIAQNISYCLYAVWFIVAVYVRIAILKDKKQCKK